MTRTVTERFSDDLAPCLGVTIPSKIGVALSGGGDSTALLTLMSDWAEAQKVAIEAITVDHGLRKAAVDEAARAGEYCRSLGISHETRRWTGWNGKGNLQDRARHARLDLIGKWAAERGISMIALGHTMDDQAETFLMRLSRGSGVDGLSGMGRLRIDEVRHLTWIRPLLSWRRSELRDLLKDRGVAWSDDPSNEDPRFERVRMRTALKSLPVLGLSVERLAATAGRMRSARWALERATSELALKISTVTIAGDIEIKAAPFFDAPPDIRLRLFSHALKWVGGGEYRPRQQAIESALKAVKNGRRHSLAGCFVTKATGGCLRISREPAAVYGKIASPGELFDGRWRVESPIQNAQYHVAALGEQGLRDCSNWKSTGLPRDSLMASPAIWQGEILLSAPLAAEARGWAAHLQKDANHFITSILSH